MKTTITTTIAITAAALILGAGMASAAQVPSAKQLSKNVTHVHRGPAGIGTEDVPPGTPTAGKPRKGTRHTLQRVVGRSTVSGYITSNGGMKIGGASVTIQYWNGSKWVSSLTARANSNGYYSFSMSSGWYYRIRAAAITGQCNRGLGYMASWLGTSNYFYAASSRSYTLTLALKPTKTWYC